jgi:ketosteroid isomerase-like protein
MEQAKSALDMLHRLERATDSHDLETLVDCFAVTYLNETPLHPARGFRGREQVRRNWTEIFNGVPDLRAHVLRSAVDGRVVWSEWELSGTRRDGATHLMRGVIIFDVDDGRATAARFYLESVDGSTDDVTAAVRATLGFPR